MFIKLERTTSNIIIPALLLAIILLTSSVISSSSTHLVYANKLPRFKNSTALDQQTSNGEGDGSTSSSPDCKKDPSASGCSGSSGGGDGGSSTSNCGKKGCDNNPQPPSSNQVESNPPPEVSGNTNDGTNNIPPTPCFGCGPEQPTTGSQIPIGPSTDTTQPTSNNPTNINPDSTRSRIITLEYRGMSMRVNSTINVRNVDSTSINPSSDNAPINQDDFWYISQGGNNSASDYGIGPILAEPSDDGIKDVYVSVPSNVQNNTSLNNVSQPPGPLNKQGTTPTSTSTTSGITPVVISSYLSEGTTTSQDMSLPSSSSLLHFVSDGGGGGHNHRHHHHHHLVVYYSLSPDCEGQIRDNRNDNQIQQCVITIVPRSAAHVLGTQPTVVIIPDVRNDYSQQQITTPSEIHLTLEWSGSESGPHASQSFSATPLGRISAFTTNDRSIDFRITANTPTDYRQSFSYGCIGTVEAGDIAFCNLGYDAKPPDNNSQPRVTFFTITNNNQPPNAYFVHVIDNNGDSYMFRGSPIGQSVFLSAGSQYQSWISGPSGSMQSTSGACSGIVQMGNDLSCIFNIDSSNTLGQQTTSNAGAVAPNYSQTDLQRLQQPGVIIR